MRKYYSSCAGSNLLALLSSLFIHVPALALPQGAELVHGEVEISTPTQTDMQLQQYSQRAVVNYQGFSIAENETLRIIQPNTEAALLNRVIGSNLSEIHGQIHSNGNVYLINPQGILFGAAAQVDVGSLTASTHALSDSNFLGGVRQFGESQSSASITNMGKIHSISENGVTFISPIIINHGEIIASGGNIHFAQASGYLLSNADSPIAMMVDDLSNPTLIENRGHLRATRIEERGGEVTLIGASQSEIYNYGEIRVSSEENTGETGRIDIYGQRIAHMGRLQAESQGDGGNIALHASDLAALAAQSIVSANAGAIGDGGEITIFSPGTTLFHVGAKIEARGGQDFGNGGYVDVSGLRQVEAYGLVDVSAFAGEHGMFLIDPENITITNTDNLITPSNPFQASGSGFSTLSVATLEAALNGGANIEVRTNLDFGDGEAGHIAIESAINLDGANGGSLSLIADGNITLTSGTTISDQTPLTPDNVNINFTAGGGIVLQDSSQIDAGSASISMVAGGNIQIASLITQSTLANAISISGANLFDAGDTHIDLIAPNGGATILVANDIGVDGNGVGDGIETQLASINLSASGNSQINEADNLILEALNAGGGNLAFTLSSGTLTLPSNGISTTARIDISARDLNGIDIGNGERNIQITADQLRLNLSDPAGDLTILSSVNELDLAFSGASVYVQQNSTLTLRDLNNDAQATNINNGNLFLTLLAGDLLIQNDILSSDTSGDSLRSGLLDFSLNDGSIFIGQNNSVQIQSSNLIENNLNGGLGIGFNNQPSQTSIRFELANNGALTRGIVLSNNSAITAVGGDIELDGLGGSLANVQNNLVIQIDPGSILQAYNNASDLADGRVYLNGGLTTSSDAIIARSQRSISLRPSDFIPPSVNPELPPSAILESLFVNSSGLEHSRSDFPESRFGIRPNAEQAFIQLYGDCEKLENARAERCKLDTALKAFLSHWTVGGQLPRAGGVAGESEGESAR